MAGDTTIRDRAVDTVRQVAHVAHEARLLKTLATDAVEDGVHAAKRAITRGLHDFDDLRESAAHRVKRAPLLTVGLAAAGGLLFGIALGWLGRRSRQKGV
jgi:ElaB/YqjD/DUF883 family membrane-anchored ribosome-binding protein